MKYFKRIFMAVLIAIFCLASICIKNALADSPKDTREIIITKELNYLEDSFAHRKQILNSRDVCYSEEDSKKDRDEAIDKALKEAAQDISQPAEDTKLPDDKEVQDEAPEALSEEGIYEDTEQDFDYIYPDEGFLEEPFEKEDSLSEFRFGTFYSYFEYEEPDYMRDKGYMYGIYGSYTHRISENKHIKSFNDVISDENKINMFRIDGSFSWGYVDYDSEGTGSMDDVRDFMFETRAVAGYDFPLSDVSRVTPYIGIGYRYLNDDSGGRTTSTNHSGYERESNYFYIPFGIETFNELAFNWSILATFEYDWLLAGRQKSHLEDVDSDFSTVENDQKTGYGLRGSVEFLRNGSAFDILIEPFIKYWSIEDSEISDITYSGVLVGFGLEPRNNSTEYGIKVGARF